MTHPIPWGEHSLEIEAPFYVVAGKLNIEVSRTTLDWRTSTHYNQDRYLVESSRAVTHARAVFRETSPTLTISPTVADRHVVARPVAPLLVPAGESATLYISSPLWLQCHAEGTCLLDLPLEIMSDCWFGPNPRVGQLCYSNQTQARMFVDLLPSRPDRLVSPVTVINKGSESVTIERLRLPLPYLSLYGSPEGWWTQEITVTSTDDIAAAEIDLAERAPTHVSELTPVHGPRQNPDKSILDSLESLFA